MMLQEFETLTDIHPTLELWELIERAYNESKLDKLIWCARFKMNENGIAERLARDADALATRRTDMLRHDLNQARMRINQLENQLADAKAQLDRELGWQPATDIGTNMSEHDYQLLADDTAPMSELDAIRRIAHECGFDMSCIKLVPTVETFDVNKHQKCRVSGTYSRLPVWASTDWNYIRFDVCDNQWEIVNGELMPYYD